MRQDAREAAAFIRPMLEMDPDKRASAKEMLDHPWLQDFGKGDDVRANPGSSVQGGHGAQAARLSPSSAKTSSPGMSPEVPDSQDVQEDGDTIMKVEGEEREDGQEKDEGERDDENEEAGDEESHEGHAAASDEEEGDACAAAADGDGDSGADEAASCDSDVRDPEEEKVTGCEAKTAVPLAPVTDSELLKDPPLTELEGNAPEVRTSAGEGMSAHLRPAVVRTSSS